MNGRYLLDGHAPTATPASPRPSPASTIDPGLSEISGTICYMSDASSGKKFKSNAQNVRDCGVYGDSA